MANKSLEAIEQWQKKCKEGREPDMTTINFDIVIPTNMKTFIQEASYLDVILKEALACITMRLMMFLKDNGQEAFHKIWHEICSSSIHFTKEEFEEWVQNLNK